MAQEYHSYYDWKILGYADLTFCVIISISNALVILVLTRKKLSPLDLIFTHIGITESLAAIAYIPRVWQEFFRGTWRLIREHRTREWEKLSIYSFTVAFLLRTVAVWLSVMLAVWRYMAVLHPLKARVWCNMQSTRIFIIIGYVLSFAITVPPYLSIDVQETDVVLNQNAYIVTDSSLGNNTKIYAFQLPLEKNPFWYTVTMLSYAIFLKILPSLGIAVIIYKLIVALLETKKCNQEMSLNSHHYARTTIILILVSVLFVISEVPHGIYALLSGVFGPDFFWNYHYRAMEIFNSLSHVSTSFNFIIYYTMSDQFRQIFKKMINSKARDTTSVQHNVRSSFTTSKSFRTVNQTPADIGNITITVTLAE